MEIAQIALVLGKVTKDSTYGSCIFVMRTERETEFEVGQLSDCTVQC